METIKNTVANVLGSSKSDEADTATHGTLGHHGHSSNTTDTTGSHHGTSGTTTDTLSHNSGTTTGVTGSMGDAAPSFHDQSRGGTGSTLSQGGTGTSTTGTHGTGLGRETTAASGTTGVKHGTNEGTATTGVGHGTSDTTTTHGTKSNDLSPSQSHPDRKDAQSPDQGPDPALVGDAKDHPKMVGQGAPGSHSAVFGLTPDGKKHKESSHGAAPIRPAHSKETTLGRKSVVGASGADSGGDTVSGGRGGVSDQIDAPDTGKKGLERTDPAPISASNSGGKPGAGLTGLGQS